MRLPFFFICCGLLLTGALSAALRVHGPTQHSPEPPLAGPKIKVLLEKDVPSAFLEAKGAFRVIRKDSGTILSTGRVGKRFVVHALQDGLRWGEEYPDVYQISVVPLSSDTYIFLNGIQYKGAISIYHVRDNHITIVNEVPIEDYLKSTLAVQFEESLSQEAMAALAIAARTEAYMKVLQGEKITRPWDISAKVASYYGYGVTQQKNGVEEAVDLTRYIVLNSIKEDKPMQNVQIAKSKADELAKRGMDAKKILQSLYPQTKLAATIDQRGAIIR